MKELAGTALADATVTVNELPADRFGPWWSHAFAVDNASSAAYTQAVVTAVYNPPGTNDPDVVTSATGHVFVAETPEAFTYDDDGNLTRDGRFDYIWDAENRLISATTRDDLSADLPRVRVTHQYDPQSRRIATARETWSGTAWQPAGTNRYLYDGWNVVAETRSASPANTNLYVWGLDLSGTLQGAGGIGGLLLVRKQLDDGLGLVRNLDYLYDANGNVVQEIMRNGGSIHAHYEYDPFGNTVVATGVDATDNPFRFSTKWFDNDTGLGYWGYRWYGPWMGRWLSRDPVGEIASRLLYSMVQNATCNRIDPLGLDDVRVVDGVVYYVRESFFGVDQDTHRLGTVDANGTLHLDPSLKDLFGPVADQITLDMLKGLGSADTYEKLVQDVYRELVGKLAELEADCSALKSAAEMLEKSAAVLGQRPNSQSWDELLSGLSIVGRRGLLSGGLTSEGKKLPKCQQKVIRFLEKSDPLNSNPRAAQHPGGPGTWFASGYVYRELWREAEQERLEFFSEVLRNEVKMRERKGTCCDGCSD